MRINFRIVRVIFFIQDFFLGHSSSSERNFSIMRLIFTFFTRFHFLQVPFLPLVCFLAPFLYFCHGSYNWEPCKSFSDFGNSGSHPLVRTKTYASSNSNHSIVSCFVPVIKNMYDSSESEDFLVVLLMDKLLLMSPTLTFFFMTSMLEMITQSVMRLLPPLL